MCKVDYLGTVRRPRIYERLGHAHLPKEAPEGILPPERLERCLVDLVHEDGGELRQDGRRIVSEQTPGRILRYLIPGESYGEGTMPSRHRPDVGPQLSTECVAERASLAGISIFVVYLINACAEDAGTHAPSSVKPLLQAG